MTFDATLDVMSLKHAISTRLFIHQDGGLWLHKSQPLFLDFDLSQKLAPELVEPDTLVRTANGLSADQLMKKFGFAAFAAKRFDLEKNIISALGNSFDGKAKKIAILNKEQLNYDPRYDALILLVNVEGLDISKTYTSKKDAFIYADDISQRFEKAAQFELDWQPFSELKYSGTGNNFNGIDHVHINYFMQLTA